MKRKKKLLQTDGCGVNFLGFGRADWENYFSFFFFFHFPHNFSWKARFSTESKKERKKKDRGRRPYYLLTYNSTSNDSDSFKKQQKVC